MATNTDPRFQPSRFRGAPAPLRRSANSGNGAADQATRQKLFADSDAKNLYTKSVRIEREPTAHE